MLGSNQRNKLISALLLSYVVAESSATMCHEFNTSAVLTKVFKGLGDRQQLEQIVSIREAYSHALDMIVRCHHLTYEPDTSLIVLRATPVAFTGRLEDVSFQMLETVSTLLHVSGTM